MKERGRGKKGEMQTKEVVQTQFSLLTENQCPVSPYLKYSSLWILVTEDGSLWSSPLVIWVSCPGYIPSPLLLHPISLAGRAAWEAEEGLLLCKCCSATAKPQCVTNIILITQPEHCTLTGCYEEN